MGTEMQLVEERLLELQFGLLSLDDDEAEGGGGGEGLLAECAAWFQPQHLAAVVEELASSVRTFPSLVHAWQPGRLDQRVTHRRPRPAHTHAGPMRLPRLPPGAGGGAVGSPRGASEDRREAQADRGGHAGDEHGALRTWVTVCMHLLTPGADALIEDSEITRALRMPHTHTHSSAATLAWNRRAASPPASPRRRPSSAPRRARTCGHAGRSRRRPRARPSCTSW